ncbi:MAG TPA: lysozyme [Aestuariivirga sp.]|nr:lysozyme [Aestuariivirga sp.]
MKVSAEGLALIREQEGFRGLAYRDAAGVWTIGYGHTAMAGPPEVRPGMKITRAEAEEILTRDVAEFSAGVARAVAVPLSDTQFSALVSFAYNVGLGNFRRSSVLKAVNAGDFAAVPRRLGLWVKAGGRTLPGLIRRRAAEAAMFAGAPKEAAQTAPPDVPEGKSLARSRTVLAALLAALAAMGQALLSPTALMIGLLAAALTGAGVVIYERRRKAREEGV